MSKFKKKGSNELPAISTASLPDIVFMLLFFFMAATTMREVTLKIIVRMPEASEVKKLEKKSLVSYIYVGKPNKQYEKKFGSEPRIQLNDALKDIPDIGQYIASEREKRDEADIPFMTTALKVDGDTKMGIITDIKQELRKSNALKINYSTRKLIR
jgi:biopolymer transport protein ExbD